LHTRLRKLLRLLLLKQPAWSWRENLAAHGWILHGRIRERLKPPSRLSWSAGRERRIRGIQGLNSPGLADLRRLSIRNGKTGKNLRVGRPRNRLAWLLLTHLWLTEWLLLTERLWLLTKRLWLPERLWLLAKRLWLA